MIELILPSFFSVAQAVDALQRYAQGMEFLAEEKRWWYVDASSCEERFGAAQNAGRAVQVCGCIHSPCRI